MLRFLLEAPTVTLSTDSVLTTASSVLTWLLTNVLNVFNTMVQSPIVLIFIVMAIIGVLVGYTKKLLHA